MFDRNNPEILWVSPDSSSGGQGTWENPYCLIREALQVIKPGNTIVLKEGIYRDNQTFEISGTPQNPVRIVADDGATVIIEESCCFFYDTSDLIISGIIFKNSPFGAISVIGTCKRNRFDSLQFINCGSIKESSCTMYFGGSGGCFNVVENCRFERENQFNDYLQTTDNASIAVMISEGDTNDSTPLLDHILRRNHFSNYGIAVLIGTRDSTTNPYGHIVEFNTIRRCASDGIIVKCGDTQIRGNLLENCRSCSISIQAGIGSIIENNRITDSNTGISINGTGHSVTNNCLVRCKDEAIRVCGKQNEERAAASNLLIEKNTLIQCCTPENQHSVFIRIEPGTTSIIQQNLFHGKMHPYHISDFVLNQKEEFNSAKQMKTETVIDNNLGSGDCEILKGITARSVEFIKNETDSFENDSGYGASGWVLKPEGFDIDGDEHDKETDYLEASVLVDDDGNLIIPGENFNDDIFSRYYSESMDLQNFYFEENENGYPEI